ncbi:MAG TPA: hypothetical protein VEV61_06010 [Streptosporangiaceae bacterium]|nr:hypothetical protein [Streptosporangiaceae bacterium]
MTAEREVLPAQALPGYFEIFTLHGQVHWRLLSRNNRDSGQSGLPFSDRKACQLGIARMIEVMPELQPQHTLTDNRWNWALQVDGEVLARSSHSFDRRIRCVAACDWFRSAAPLAAIRDGQRVVRGPRLSRQGYARQAAMP